MQARSKSSSSLSSAVLSFLCCTRCIERDDRNTVQAFQHNAATANAHNVHQSSLPFFPSSHPVGGAKSPAVYLDERKSAVTAFGNDNVGITAGSRHSAQMLAPPVTVQKATPSSVASSSSSTSLLEPHMSVGASAASVDAVHGGRSSLLAGASLKPNTAFLSSSAAGCSINSHRGSGSSGETATVAQAAKGHFSLSSSASASHSPEPYADVGNGSAISPPTASRFTFGSTARPLSNSAPWPAVARNDHKPAVAVPASAVAVERKIAISADRDREKHVMDVPPPPVIRRFSPAAVASSQFLSGSVPHQSPRSRSRSVRQSIVRTQSQSIAFSTSSRNFSRMPALGTTGSLPRRKSVSKPGTASTLPAAAMSTAIAAAASAAAGDAHTRAMGMLSISQRRPSTSGGDDRERRRPKTPNFIETSDRAHPPMHIPLSSPSAASMSASYPPSAAQTPTLPRSGAALAPSTSSMAIPAAVTAMSSSTATSSSVLRTSPLDDPRQPHTALPSSAASRHEPPQQQLPGSVLASGERGREKERSREVGSWDRAAHSQYSQSPPARSPHSHTRFPSVSHYRSGFTSGDSALAVAAQALMESTVAELEEKKRAQQQQLPPQQPQFLLTSTSQRSRSTRTKTVLSPQHQQPLPSPDRALVSQRHSYVASSATFSVNAAKYSRKAQADNGHRSNAPHDSSVSVSPQLYNAAHDDGDGDVDAEDEAHTHGDRVNDGVAGVGVEDEKESEDAADVDNAAEDSRSHSNAVYIDFHARVEEEMELRERDQQIGAASELEEKLTEAELAEL